jgi:hypothetical protein
MSQPAPAANEKSKTSEPPFVPVPVVPQYIEEALLDRLKKKAREKCKQQIENYVECTKNRVFSIAWKCRGHLKEMNDCLGNYTKKKELDRLKIEWAKLQAEKEAQKLIFDTKNVLDTNTSQETKPK